MNKLQLTNVQSFPSKDDVGKFTINKAIQIQSVVTLVLNVLLWIVVIVVPELRRSRRCQYYLNLLIIHIILAAVILKGSPTLSFTYSKDTLLIIVIFSKLMYTRGCYKETNDSTNNSDISAKDVITVVATCVWAPPLLLLCVTLIAGVSWIVWSLISVGILSASILALCISNIYLFFRVKRQKDDGEDSEPKDATQEGMSMRLPLVCLSITASVTIFSLPHIIYTLLLVTNCLQYATDVNCIIFQITFFASSVDPVLFMMFSREMKRVLKKLNRMLNWEKRELDRKKSRHLLMRDRFSGSI